jgi:hypothetical protein
MYQFKEQINYKNYFKFRKSIVQNGLWARLPPSTKSIYPVIACHADKTGEAFPSEQTIAILAGCTEKTVREGLEGMLDMPGVNISSRITKRGHRQKVYTLPPPKDNESVFYFYKNIIEGGNWCQLRKEYGSRSAHAVYCTLYAFSYFDIDLYLDLEGLELVNDDEFDEGEFYYCDGLEVISEDGKTKLLSYKDRNYDFVDADIDVIAEYSGIGIGTAEDALYALTRAHLLNPLPSESGWQIFRIPPKYYKRDFLNDRIPQQAIAV